MAKGILYVESRPNSPEEAAAFHEWYDEVHMKEIAAIDGFVSARRFAPLGDDGPFIAIYEIEADDIEAVRNTFTEHNKAGKMSPPVGVQFDPPPVVRYFREIAAHRP